MSVATISASQLKDLLQNNGDLELIDVREPFEFQSVHVTKARNIPLHHLNPNNIIRQRKIETTKPLYIICHSNDRCASRRVRSC